MTSYNNGRGHLLGRWIGAIALLLVLASPTIATADSLLVSVVPSDTPIAVPPGASGTLELLLSNPSANTQTFNISAFAFELSGPGGSGVLFDSALTSTSGAIYIFAGNSVADDYFAGDLVVSPPPPPATSDLAGLDSVSAFGSSIALAPGETVGLALISFSVSGGAGPGVIPITIIPFDFVTAPAGTLISDASGNAIDFTTANGTITIQATGAVPEPSSVVMIGLGVCGVVGMVSRRRCKF